MTSKKAIQFNYIFIINRIVDIVVNVQINSRLDICCCFLSLFFSRPIADRIYNIIDAGCANGSSLAFVYTETLLIRNTGISMRYTEDEKH